MNDDVIGRLLWWNHLLNPLGIDRSLAVVIKLLQKLQINKNALISVTVLLNNLDFYACKVCQIYSYKLNTSFCLLYRHNTIGLVRRNSIFPVHFRKTAFWVTKILFWELSYQNSCKPLLALHPTSLSFSLYLWPILITIVIYDSRVVPDLKILHIMTLDSLITSVNFL